MSIDRDLIGRLEFIRDYECKVDAEVNAINEALAELSKHTEEHTETHSCVCEHTETHAEPEPLTDREQRIFLAAMGREEKVCKQIDEECMDCREPYEDSLVWICHEITRKVKGALWTI